MASHAGPNIIEDNLVLCLDSGNTKSYPGTGTTWTDMINAHSATMKSPVDYQSIFGGVMHFAGGSPHTDDGSDEYVTLPTSALPNGLGATSTIEIWNYWDNASQPGGTWPDAWYGALFTNSAEADWSSGAGGDNGLIFGYNMIVRKNASGSQINTSYSPQPATQTWHQHVLTLNSGTGTVYVDKSQVMSASTFRTNYGQSNGTLGIGIADTYSSKPRGEFDGYISIVRIYDKVLSTAEIKQNFDATKRRYGL